MQLVSMAAKQNAAKACADDVKAMMGSVRRIDEGHMWKPKSNSKLLGFKNDEMHRMRLNKPRASKVH